MEQFTAEIILIITVLIEMVLFAFVVGLSLFIIPTTAELVLRMLIKNQKEMSKAITTGMAGMAADVRERTADFAERNGGGGEDD